MNIEPHTSLFTVEERAEIKSLVKESLHEFFRGIGIKGYGSLTTTAIIVGALVVIFGGVKTVLGWIGFIYLSR